MLQDEIGSILRFCYDINPVKIYTDRIPQDMAIPCMYFPAPMVISAVDTITGYRNTYQLFAKVFDKKTQQAHVKAHEIAEKIRASRGIIPVIGFNGDPSEEYMQVNLGLQTKVIDDGVVQLALKWDSQYPFIREEFPMMEALFIEALLKREGD